MSKGNSLKGNRETKKPKKETPKVLATASTVSHPIRIETGSKKENRMKLSLIFTMLLGIISTASQAEQFNLKKPNDNYVSLNECLYALSKGTRLVNKTGAVFIYQNSVWELSFTAEQKFECELLGELTE